jgi:hypothetical protein
MNIPTWLHRLHHRLFGPRLIPRQTAPHSRRSVRPGLEVLEDRLTPAMISGGGGTTAPPPTLSQAFFSLALDGATIEATSQASDSIDNIDEYFGSPSQVAAAEAKAATRGINFDATMSLLQILGSVAGRNLNMVQADIAFYAPYAEPFSELAVFAGARAALQAVQLPPSAP